jgi:hypothetical protein
LQTICLGWSGTWILLMSASKVASIYRCEPPVPSRSEFFVSSLINIGRCNVSRNLSNSHGYPVLHNHFYCNSVASVASPLSLLILFVTWFI